MYFQQYNQYNHHKHCLYDYSDYSDHTDHICDYTAYTDYTSCISMIIIISITHIISILRPFSLLPANIMSAPYYNPHKGLLYISGNHFSVQTLTSNIIQPSTAPFSLFQTTCKGIEAICIRRIQIL